MSDPERTATARSNLRSLAQRLLEEARQLGDVEAVKAAEELHAHAHTGSPNRESLAAQLRTLETKLALSPTLSAFLAALANVGL